MPRVGEVIRRVHEIQAREILKLAKIVRELGLTGDQMLDVYNFLESRQRIGEQNFKQGSAKSREWFSAVFNYATGEKGLDDEN